LNWARQPGLPCPACGGSSDLATLLDAATGAWPAERCVAVRCPRCEGELTLELASERVAIGSRGEAPRAPFRPEWRVDQPGLLVDSRPEGLLVRLQHRQWVWSNDGR
jgi:hypothetical protein